MSVMEISHRSKTFDEIIGQAEQDCANFWYPNNYRFCFAGQRQSAIFNGAMNLCAMAARIMSPAVGAKGSQRGENGRRECRCHNG
jgi:phosphoserine aminotransferase